MKNRTLLSWSSGKDSAWALHVLRQDAEIEFAGLFTTVNAKHQRVAMHAVRLRLLELQAESVGLPLRVLEIPDPCSDKQYEAVMTRFVDEAIGQGIECMAFGDLFLQDIREYREKQLRPTGITPLFPLWNRPTHQLAAEMLAGGLRAFVTCVDPASCPADLPAASGRRRFSTNCPPASIPAPRTASFTPWSSMVRCFVGRFPFGSARRSSATASSSPTLCRSSDVHLPGLAGVRCDRSSSRCANTSSRLWRASAKSGRISNALRYSAIASS